MTEPSSSSVLREEDPYTQILSRIFAQSLAGSELESAGGGLQGAALRCCSRATRDLAGLRRERESRAQALAADAHATFTLS